MVLLKGIRHLVHRDLVGGIIVTCELSIVGGIVVTCELSIVGGIVVTCELSIVGGIVITCELSIVGGIGEAVMAAVAEERNIIVRRLAVNGVPRSGKCDELLEMFGISKGAITRAVKEVMKL